MATNQRPAISKTAFIKAREEGKTVGELSKEFGISQANVKQIISKLELPKRAKRVGYVLVEEDTREGSSESNNQQA